MSRYSRQELLPEVGGQGQERLANTHMLVIGAGGLAASCLPLLAGAGVGTLSIVDGDTVEGSNLHRQTLFRETDIGSSKADCAAQYCQALNSEIIVASYSTNVAPSNVTELIADADIILDCADSYAASYLLNDHCLATGKPLISASALAFSGYVGGFCGHAPSLRAVFPNAPQNAQNCATAGVIGPLVSVLGAQQAQMAINHVLEIDPSPLGMISHYDAKTLQTRSFRFDSATEPETIFSFISPSDVKDDDLVLELRNETEAPSPIHANAKRVKPDDIGHLVLPKTGRIAIGCATGLRAWRAAEKLQPKWQGEISLLAASIT